MHTIPSVWSPKTLKQYLPNQYVHNMAMIHDNVLIIHPLFNYV